jgi:hypothetical protein
MERNSNTKITIVKKNKRKWFRFSNKFALFSLLFRKKRNPIAETPILVSHRNIGNNLLPISKYPFKKYSGENPVIQTSKTTKKKNMNVKDEIQRFLNKIEIVRIAFSDILESFIYAAIKEIDPINKNMRTIKRLRENP